MHKAESKKLELIFIILIPIFLILLAFLYDIILQNVQTKNLERVTREIITETLTTGFYNHDFNEKFKNDFEASDIDTDHLSVRYEDEVLYVYNSHSYGAFSGRVFGTHHYRSEVNLKAFLDGEEVIIDYIEDEN